MDSTTVQATRADHRTRDVFVAGALAGLLASAAMVVFMLAAALVDDRPIEMALRPLVAYLDAEGAAAVLVAVLQLAIASAVLGFVLVGVLPRDVPPGGAAVVGAAYALLVMSILTSVAEELQSTMAPLGGSWVIAFGIFGAVLGAAPALLRWRGRRPAPATPAPRAVRHGAPA